MSIFDANNPPIYMDRFPSHPLPKPVKAKNKPFRALLHYSDPLASKVFTVFGAEKEGLFYNYSDRLGCSKWYDGLKKAKQETEENTAKYFEIALNHFHDATDVNLQHVMLGCNRSNGQSYLVFGYTYTSPKG